jgi:nucleotide-binding universal stress UspA family protein
MIRSILFPLAEGPPVASARDFAFWFARTCGCRIQVLAVVDIKAFEIPVLGTPDGFMPTVVAPPIRESQTLLEELTAAAREHLERFAAECAARGIPCSTDLKTGIPGEIVAREATAHDLVVMARTGYTRSAAAQQHIEPLVPQVIRGSIRPVLVAGRQFPSSGEIANILVAFDGSSHAARALSVAALVSARPGIQCILAIAASSEDEGNETLAPAETYLYHHGLTPRKQVVVGAKPSESICDLVATLGIDILIMGAYGHSPIREVLFGSTTEHVLRQCGCTVILQS